MTVEPLPHMPLVKDLACDMADFSAKSSASSRTSCAVPGAREEISPGPRRPAQARYADRLHPVRLLLQLLPVGVG